MLRRQCTVNRRIYTETHLSLYKFTERIALKKEEDILILEEISYKFKCFFEFLLMNGIDIQESIVILKGKIYIEGIGINICIDPLIRFLKKEIGMLKKYYAVIQIFYIMDRLNVVYIVGF